jgi:hypothetical protein
MDEAMVMKMLDHRNSDLPDRTKAALDLAEDFILNHADNVDDAFIERMKQYFTEEQLVELTVAIGTWDSVHKFNKVFDVDPPVEDGQLFTVGLPDVPKGMEQHLSCFVPDAVAADG